MRYKLKKTVYIVLLLVALCAAALVVRLRVHGPGAGKPAPEATPAPDYTGLLRISELMGKNRATLTDESGGFADYVELENFSDRTVELEGWALSDKEGSAKWTFPSLSIAPGELILLFCGGEEPLGPDFSISQGETLYLLDPDGRTQSAVLCSTDESGVAVELGEDGTYHETRWATPGYPNTRQGYMDCCAAAAAAGPVVINEVMSANTLYAIQPGMDGEDWVELKNISDSPVDLSGWHLSDKYSDYTLWTLPEQTLQPGEKLLVYCSGEEESSTEGYIHTNFSLNALEETLYLTDSTGRLADYVHLHDLLPNGSMGRMDGENGFFYFEKPSPWEDNAEGYRFVSQAPQTTTPDGIFNDVNVLTVELSALAPGVIYYTTDGTLPTTESEMYREPISIDKTSVIRAAAQEEGGAMSPVVTFSYIVNEHHSLPVLSIVVDDLPGFDRIYNARQKNADVPANAALYGDEAAFNRRCTVSLKGWTSLSLPKKSLGLDFKGVYGGDLFCDVFSNGVTRYASLSVRAGQDYTTSIFRNELLEDLILEMGDRVYTQYSKFCILYLNGEYRGIYCLKEDFSRQYYASRTGVSKDSVTMYRTPAPLDSDFFRQVVRFSWDMALTKEENYETISQVIDIDSLIDWIIIEGYSANTDVQGNARVFRSSENGGKWTFAAYDFDWAFYYGGSDFTVLFEDEVGNAGNQMPPLIRNIMQNPDFRTRFLIRFAELNKTVLSNEHVLEKIDELEALLEPEVARERERWGSSVDSWQAHVENLRAFIRDSDWANHNIMKVQFYLKMTDEEAKEYFG